MIQFFCRGGQIVAAVQGREVWALGGPSVRTPDGRHDQPGAWRQESAATFVCGGGAVQGRLSVGQLSPASWRCSLEVDLTEPLTITEVRVPQVLAFYDLHYLDRSYRWQQGRRQDVVDSLTPGCLAGRVGDHTVSLRFSRHGALLLQGSPERVDLLLDHAELHPRVVFDSGRPRRRDYYIAAPGRSFWVDIVLGLHESGPDLLPGPVPWRYPGRALAGLVITDHADWDTPESVVALYSREGGFAATRLRTTKSVFFQAEGYTSPDRAFRPFGLDNPAMVRVADELHAQGHEVCPHSIVPSGKAPVDLAVVRRTLKFFARRYAPGTWIDHGLAHQPFNYSQSGWDPDSSWFLCSLLREHGFNNAWAFYDTTRYPLRSLNQLARPDPRRCYLLGGFRALARFRPWAALPCLRQALSSTLDDQSAWRLGQIASLFKGAFVSSSNLRARRVYLRRLFSESRELFRSIRPADGEAGVAFFPVLYAEPGLPLGQAWPDDLVLFATQLVNNWDVAYANLGTLIAQHGLHIAHTYLGNQRPYTARALIPHNGGWRVSDRFVALLAQLDDHVGRGELWNPTMQECAAWFKTWCQVRVDPMGRGRAVVTNPTRQRLTGFSLAMPGGARWAAADGVELALSGFSPRLACLDLAPHTKVWLEWEEGQGAGDGR